MTKFYLHFLNPCKILNHLCLNDRNEKVNLNQTLKTGTCQVFLYATVGMLLMKHRHWPHDRSVRSWLRHIENIVGCQSVFHEKEFLLMNLLVLNMVQFSLYDRTDKQYSCDAHLLELIFIWHHFIFLQDRFNRTGWNPRLTCRNYRTTSNSWSTIWKRWPQWVSRGLGSHPDIYCRVDACWCY